MELLSYKKLKDIGYKGYLLEDAPEKVLQFGEGAFLRAFADQFIDVMNEKAGFNGKVVLVQPRSRDASKAEEFAAQEGLYTQILRGRENDEAVSLTRVISSISRCLNLYENWKEFLKFAANKELRFIISNTTEAGITFDESCRIDDAPPAAFPAKLTVFLYERYKLGLPGFVILPCELIDNNGEVLKSCVESYIKLWKLDEGFRKFIDEENMFCSTLVDRIVTGYPEAEAEGIFAEIGYKDKLLNTGEIFASWVIEAPDSLKEELPFEKAGLPVIFVKDHTAYKKRKVRILNGAHTSMIMAGYLSGQDIVRGCMEDDIIRGFMNKAIYEEIIPTLDLPKNELLGFAASVTQRFNNPYIDHSLLAISLNSSSKWKARVMPSLIEYTKRFGRIPKCLAFSFAAYIAFYHTAKEKGENCLIGIRGGNTYEIKDDEWILDFYIAHAKDSEEELVRAVIENEALFGTELKNIGGFEETVVFFLKRIGEIGMYRAMEECL